MSKQILKKVFPNEILFKLIELIAAFKTDTYYLLNKSSFKKALYYDLIGDFVEQCKECYHSSKHKYLTSVTDQKRLITIIRQICNHNNVKYTSKIQYDKSRYDINYYIYFN